MKFELQNVIIENVVLNKTAEVVNGMLIVDLSKELNDSEASVEVSLYEFNNGQLTFVDYEDTKIGNKYVWSYVDDSIHDLNEMSEEEHNELGFFVRIS